jgi:autotransporter-associated beta strand protein
VARFVHRFSSPEGNLFMQQSLRSGGFQALAAPMFHISRPSRRHFRHHARPAALAVLTLFALLPAQPARALQISDLLPFGAAAGDISLARGDDNSSPTLSLLGIGPAGSSLSLPFYGSSYTNLIVNNNGNVTFNGPVASYSPTGFPNASNIPMIAPYWADVDTRNALSGLVWYRTTQDTATLNTIGQTIHNSFLGTSSFAPTYAEIVTWDHVGYFSSLADKLNTFQLLIVSDGIQTYGLFEYPQGGINWTQGSANPPGTYASVGFDAGDGVDYFNVQGSMTSSTLNLPNQTDTLPSQAGLFAFRIDNSAIVSSGGGVTAPTQTWGGGIGNWSVGGTNWTGAATTWKDGNTAAFGGTASIVTLAGPVTVEDMELNTSGYLFTASSAANSLQFNSLTFGSPSDSVTFGGSLVVVTNQVIPNSSSTISEGNLNFIGNSVLVARGAGAVNGGNFHLQNSAQIQIYSAGATTRAATLTFDNTAGGTGGTLDLRGFNTTFGAISSTGAGSGIVTNSGATAAGLTVDFDTVSSTYSGVIQDGTSPLSLTKTGTGTFTLAGANTYTGGTHVNGGKLLVTNTTGSATGTGVVQVGIGGTLGGSGRIGGNTVVDGIIADDNNLDTLTFAQNLTLDSTATVKMELAPGGLHDLVAVGGALAFHGTLEIDFLSGYLPTVGTQVNLFDFASDSGTFDAITVSTPGYYGSVDYSTGVVTIVPEPSAAALLFLGCLGLAGRRRKMKARC